MRRILVGVLLITIVAPVLAQTPPKKMIPGSASFTGGGNLFFGHGGQRHHGGIFPNSPVSRERGAALFLSGFLFSDHRPTAAGSGYDYLFGGYPYGFFSDSQYGCYPYSGLSGLYGTQFFGYQGFGARPALYNSAQFVEEWKDRNPLAGGSESQNSALQQSILLRDGMDEEQVVLAVGSPVQRVQLGERTVWKYSGYSLLFEGGKLKEIR